VLFPKGGNKNSVQPSARRKARGPDTWQGTKSGSETTPPNTKKGNRALDNDRGDYRCDILPAILPSAVRQFETL
jgi:hypothetical protein